MRNIIFLFFIAQLLMSCGGGNSVTERLPPDNKETVSPYPSQVRIELLWQQTIESYLQDELWIETNNYDAGHVLMVPLHWAFADEHPNKLKFRQQFDEFFARVLANFEDTQDDNNLRRLQFYYLVSQYIKLKAEQCQQTCADLFERLRLDMSYHWTQREAVTWTYPAFPNGVKQRLDFKLNTLAPNPAYARAIFDEEFYLFAISADLRFVEGKRNTGADLTDVNDILDYANLIFETEGTNLSDGGWLFQNGVWSTYRDYAYAGHEVLAPDLQKMEIADIATDSSHMHRMPLWLISLRDGMEKDSDEYSFFQETISRFKYQFETAILVAADENFSAPRMNNYADGWNGIYRYQYRTTGESLGYGPYQLSGTLTVSWYGFAYSELYQQQLANISYPLPQGVIDVYTGPNTTREKHPLTVWPDYFTNGFTELNFTLTQQLAP